MLGFYPLAALPLYATPGSLPVMVVRPVFVPPPVRFWIAQRQAEGIRQAAQAAAYAAYDENPAQNSKLNEALLAADVQYFVTVLNAAKVTRHTVPNVLDGYNSVATTPLAE
jgi:hypothetical protein